MGTSAIALSSSDITALQDDVNEWKTKLNTLVVEFNKCSNDTTINAGKIDDLIAKISGSYTAGNTGSGSAGDSILKRLHDLDGDIKELDDDITGFHTGRTARRGGGSSSTATRDLTALTGAGADTSVDNNPTASVTGAYGAETKVITIGAKGEVRAKRLARQTLNRLRK